MKNQRRDFIKGAIGMGVVAQIPTATLVTGILNGLVGKAFAASQDPADLLNYVGLWMGGGIERWYFDAMLAPHGYNPSKIDLETRRNKIKTRTTVGSNNYIESLEYATTANKVNGKIYLPYLWESQLPGISGTVAMKELARNMISIRGVDTGVGFDAHGNNETAAENAFGYPTSISALTSTHSPYPFSGATSGAGMSAPRSPVSVDVGNISPTLKKFSLPSSGSTTAKVAFKSNEIRNVVDKFIMTLGRSMPSSKQAAAKALLGNREASKQMFDFVAQSLANIQVDYQEAYNMYSALMISVNRNHLEGRALAGLDDMSINNPNQEASFSQAKKNLLGQQFNNDDGMQFRGGGWSNNFLDEIPQSNFDTWAKTLATIEVFLKYNITNSMRVACNTHTGPLGSPFDAHFDGENHRLIQHSKHYQAIATGLMACMSRLEAIEDLQGKTVSQKTIFHLRSEFDRNPTLSGVGSHHHIRGCTESFFSKMIKDGPIAIGNIRTGNIGTGLEITRGAVVEYKHIYSTVQNIAGLVRDRNFEPLLKREGDTIVPTTDECKDVA
jgi:hypothetical protein